MSTPTTASAVRPSTHSIPNPSPGRRLWTLAGVLALAHLVVMFGSFALQRVAPLDASSVTIRADHMDWSMTKGFSGGYLTALSYLLLLAFAALFARLLRVRTEVSGWLTSTMLVAVGVAVAVTYAGMADVGAALYDGHHGASLETVTALDHAHWFNVFLATLALGLFTAATGGAALVSRVLPRWVGWSGVVVGVLCMLAVAGAGAGLVDTVTLVWTLWFIALAIAALRRGARGDGAPTRI